MAWVCFQIGMLWEELFSEPQFARAARYRAATACSPSYTKARVHLAETCSSSGRASDAKALLIPAISSGDPEVRWRLADALAQERYAEAEVHMQAAQLGSRPFLNGTCSHLRITAASGNNSRRALDLTRVNLTNRPTLRAFEQAHGIAVNAAI